MPWIVFEQKLGAAARMCCQMMRNAPFVYVHQGSGKVQLAGQPCSYCPWGRCAGLGEIDVAKMPDQVSKQRMHTGRKLGDKLASEGC